MSQLDDLYLYHQTSTTFTVILLSVVALTTVVVIGGVVLLVHYNFRNLCSNKQPCQLCRYQRSGYRGEDMEELERPPWNNIDSDDEDKVE